MTIATPREPLDHLDADEIDRVMAHRVDHDHVVRNIIAADLPAEPARRRSAVNGLIHTRAQYPTPRAKSAKSKAIS